MAVLVAIMTAISITWRLLAESHLAGSGLLYIGIPAALALLLSYLPTPGSATGRIMKGMTLFLLLVGIFLIEGIVCILIAAPLFYLVGLIVGAIVDGSRAYRKAKLNCSLAAVLLFFGLEGLTGSLSFNRNEIVTVHHETRLTPNEARSALAVGPDFDLAQLPLFLKAGFPTPQNIAGQGLEKGSQWTIKMRGQNGLDDLIVEVTEASKTRIVFSCLENDTKIGEWMDFEKIIWNLEPTDQGTNVSMTFHYRRLLDPAWYFKPIQRYGITKAGEYFMAQTFK